MRTSSESGGSALLQCSQVGLSSSMAWLHCVRWSAVVQPLAVCQRRDGRVTCCSVRRRAPGLAFFADEPFRATAALMSAWLAAWLGARRAVRWYLKRQRIICISNLPPKSDSPLVGRQHIHGQSLVLGPDLRA